MAEGVRTPPYRMETERLVIRCYRPEDAPLEKEAVDSSLEHLRPWMPWAQHEPQSIEDKVTLLRRFRANFDAGEDFAYGVFSRDESRQLAGCGLHQRNGAGTFEIGYFVRADATRQGIASELTAVLTRAAFELAGAFRVDVKVDVSNTASQAVPRKLGFPDEVVLRSWLPPFGEQAAARDCILFTMLASELAASGCLAYDYVGYDAAGNPL
ncbi:MAG TPA: GNAT family N-acetyltransferase [Gaiellaceae bacterium]|nr:GNAT family N-acetyltransferase [Gaiellaceae bacterium]